MRRYHTYPPQTTPIRGCMLRDLYAYLSPTNRAPIGDVGVSSCMRTYNEHLPNLCFLFILQIV